MYYPTSTLVSHQHEQVDNIFLRKKYAQVAVIIKMFYQTINYVLYRLFMKTKSFIPMESAQIAQLIKSLILLKMSASVKLLAQLESLSLKLKLVLLVLSKK
jgi:hypothetical protein